MRTTISVTLALLILFSVALNLHSLPKHPILQSQWQSNQYLIEQYLRFQPSNRIDTLVIGSSLTNRLDFNKTANCIYKLSLSGDGSLTALMVAMKAAITPKNIWVEINVPERDINDGLIKDSSGYLKSLPAFQIENRPLNLVLDSFHYLKSKFRSENVIKKKSVESNSNSDINSDIRLKAIALQTKSYGKEIQSNILQDRMNEFLNLVNQLESRGAIVGFFEMPTYPGLTESPKAVQVREAFKKVFPKHKFISAGELSNGLTVRTADGVHLQNDEANVVAANFDSYLRTNCN